MKLVIELFLDDHAAFSLTAKGRKSDVNAALTRVVRRLNELDEAGDSLKLFDPVTGRQVGTARYE